MATKIGKTSKVVLNSRLEVYFTAPMDSIILHLRTVLSLLSCTVSTALLFSKRKCAK